MSPVFSVIYDKAMLPYQNEEIGIEEVIKKPRFRFEIYAQSD